MLFFNVKILLRYAIQSKQSMFIVIYVKKIMRKVE